MSAPTDALPHRHRPGTARAALVVPRLPADLARAVRLQHRHVDAELHAARRTSSSAPARRRSSGCSCSPSSVRCCCCRSPPACSPTASRAARTSIVMQAIQLVVQRRAGRARRRRRAAVDAVRRARWSIGIGNALNAPAFQASVPLLVDRARPRRRRQPQLGDDQRQPGASARCWPPCSPSSASRRPQLFLVNAVTYLFLIAAILAVHIPDVRGTPSPSSGWRRLLTGINIARGRPVLARSAGDDVRLLDRLPRVRRAVPVGRAPQLRHRRRQHRLQAAVHRRGASAPASARSPSAPCSPTSTAAGWSSTGCCCSPSASAAFALVRSLGPAFPVGVRARLRLLPDGDGADHDLPGEPRRHRAGQS